MNLFQDVRQRLGWLLSLARQIRRASGPVLLATILTFLTGQLSLVLAMFLPLKVILLLASDGVPWYLAAVVTPGNKDYFIVGLAVGALVAYGVHLLCELVIAGQLNRAAATIQSRTRKLSLFRDERSMVRDAYLRFCRLTACAILVTLAGCAGLYLEPPVFGGLAVLIALECVAAHHIAASAHPAAQALVARFNAKRGRVLTTVANANFLIAFVLLFVDFLISTDRNIVVAIVSFLLLRQMNTRLRIAVSDFISLSGDRHRINPLFYTRLHYSPPTNRRAEDLLRRLSLPERGEWMREALAAVTGKPAPEIAETRWNDLGAAGIAAFDVRVAHGDATATADYDYFLRCFSAGQRHLGAHEASLFEAGSAPAFAPVYLGRTDVGDLLVLVYAGLPAGMPDARTFANQRLALLRACERTALAPALLSAYLRTHRSLPQRVDAALLERIGPALTTDADRATFAELQQRMPEIAAWVAEIPPVLRSRDIDRRTCRIDAKGQIVVWAWHRWSADLPSAQTLGPAGDDAGQATEGQRGRRALVSRLFELEAALNHYHAAEALARGRALLHLWGRLHASGEIRPADPE